MGQKGKEFRQEKSWGQSKISAFTFVRREAVIRVFPGQPQSVQSLGPLFFFFFSFPSLRTAWAPAPSPFFRKTSDGIPGI